MGEAQDDVLRPDDGVDRSLRSATTSRTSEPPRKVPRKEPAPLPGSVRSTTPAITLPVPTKRATNRVGIAKHLLGGTALGDPAFRQHRHQIAQAQRLVEVVGHLQRGDPLPLVQLPQLAPQHLARGGVHRREGLVQQQDRGPGARARASATRCCSPPLSPRTGRSSRAPIASMSASSAIRAPGSARSRWRGPSYSIADVVPHAQVGKQVVLLVDEPEPAPLRRQVGHLVVVHEDPAGLEPGVAGDGLEQGGLPRTGGTDDEGIAALGDLQRDIAEIERAHPDVQLLQPDHLRSSG